MKVLIIGSRIPFPLHDGGAIATYNLLRGLSELGIETSYISLNTHKHFIDDNTLKKEFSFLKAIIPYKIDTSIQPLKALINLFGTGSYNMERFYDLGFETLLSEHLQKHTYDIIHFEGLFVTPYLQIIKKFTKAPTLLRQHNIEYQIWERLTNNQKNPLKKWYLNILAKRMKTYEWQVVSQFDKLVSIAETDEILLKQMAPQIESLTIPGGFIIDTAELNQPNVIEENTIYHIGSMEWIPNQQAMEWFHEYVWPIIEKQMPEACFFMAGKNMSDTYKAWETNTFKVLGEVKDAHAFANKKSLLIVPLQSGSGIRMKTIEAMLQGKAVVTTSIGAQGLPIQNHVHCLIADTPKDFAMAVITLLKDSTKRNQMAKAAQACMLEHYENKKVSEQWLKCYQSMLG